MPKLIDLTGKTFGKLTVLEYVGKTRWLCRCSCKKQTEKSIAGEYLRNGRFTHCGCSSYQIDLTGKIFGKWTVLEYVGKSRWRCVCSCEKKIEKNLLSQNLRRGESKSCGCEQYNEETKKKIGTANSGENSNLWKGGVVKNGIALFDTYAHQLIPIEEVRRDPENYDVLQVRCTYDRIWFTPKMRDVQHRCQYIKGKIGIAEGRFYCSDKCKELCPIHGQQKYPKNQKPYIEPRCNQSELREMTLERDKNICQKCNREFPENELICHHIDPVINNPIESADLDNCITLCIECDKLVHKIPGCTTSELKCTDLDRELNL